MPYSNDLRKRVIATVKAGGQSLAAIAKTFQVSESTVDKWVSRWHETGSSDALPWAGGRRRTLAPCEAYIRARCVTLRPVAFRVLFESGKLTQLI